MPPNTSIEESMRALELTVKDPGRASSLLSEEIARLIDLTAGLYGFESRRIGVGESTSHCIYKLVAALEPAKVGFSSEEFPGVVMMVNSYCKRAGCEVGVYEGRIEEAVEKAVDDGSEVVVVSAVSWVTGYRTDLARVVRYAHKRGARVVVDAVQHFGGLSLREGENEADGYAASAKKWLLAPHSTAAVCVVGEELLDKTPPYYGLGNAVIDDWEAYWEDPNKTCIDTPPLRGDGLRFAAPTGVSLPSIVAARASIEYLHRLGIKRVEEHILGLARVLAEELMSYGLRVPAVEYSFENLSGIVSFDAGGVFLNKKLYKELLKRGFKVSLRGQAGVSAVRASLHVYNTIEDVESLVRAAREAAGEI